MPPELGYLREVAERYGVDDFQVEPEQGRIIAELSEDDLRKLAEAYTEIERREDAFALSKWINDTPKSDRGERAWRSMFLLVLLFGELGKRGIPPFSSQSVRLMDHPGPALDWSKLPARLRYLAQPAEKYGRIQFDDEVDRFVANVTPAQLAELRPIADRASNDVEFIREWTDKYSMVEHPEAARVHFLLTLMTQLGLW